MDFLYLLRVILKRKWIILGAAVLAAAVTYLLTRNEPKLYRSATQVSTGFAINDQININDENFSFFEAETKFSNVIVTCKSPAVINLVSYALILHDLENPKPFRKLKPEHKELPLVKSIDLAKAKATFSDKLETMGLLSAFDPEEKKLLGLLKLYGYDYNSIDKALSVYRLQRTDYLQIDHMSEHPELSAFVVNNLYQQFLRYYNYIRSNKTRESIDTLRSMVEKKKEQLDIKNAQIRGEGLVDVDIQSTSSLDLIANLEQTLTEEKKRYNELRYDLQKVSQKLGRTRSSNTRNTSSNDAVLIARKEMNDAYKAYQKSGQTDKALLARYNQLKEDYFALLQNSGSGGTSTGGDETAMTRAQLQDQKTDIELDIRATQANITSIQGKINSLKGGVSATASKGAAVATLLKEAELTEKEYLDAKQKYNDAMDINSSSLNNFRQVLPGQPAIDPEPSKRKKLVAMAGAGALVISILVLVFLAYLDSSIKTPGIFSRVVGLRMISMINMMNLKKQTLMDMVANKTDNLSRNDLREQNIFRESLRKLRYEVERSGKKVFLFTSTKKGEGKTTLIQALSYSMSLSHKRILIIDTNFCNNDLTVQLHAEPILEKLLPAKATGTQVIEQVRKASTDVGAGTVFAIGSEGGDYTPSEVLPNRNILNYLQALTADYDYIFLEGPPLNDFSDSRELSQFVDGVIAIFSANRNVKQIDRESISFFKELNGKFVGAVLNKVDLENVNVT